MTNEERKDAERVQLEQAAARAVDLDALPKALSEEERESLCLHAQTTGPRALALIDALTAALAEQAAQIVLDGQRIAELEARAEVLRRTSVVGQLEARVRELEAENDRLDESFEEAAEERQHAETRAEAAEQKLADVTSLLEQARAEADTMACVKDNRALRARWSTIEGLVRRYEDCPAEDYADAWWAVRAEVRDHLAGQPAAPSRDEAERAVLDAMRAVATTTLQQAVAPRENNPLGKLHGPCAAELARREGQR